MDLSRRAFLASSAAAGWSLMASTGMSAQATGTKNCILLMLVGGPSQIDTFDPKPDAPAEVRGPFQPIATKVPGVHLAETLPLLAQRMDRVSLLRSVYHEAAPIHETGQQLVQTGELCRGEVEVPHVGARTGAFAIVPGPILSTGVNISHGQTAGELGAGFEPRLVSRFDHRLESPQLRDTYGKHRFGQSCLEARRQIEAGTRCVVVNMFDTVFGATTWDCHADNDLLGTTLHDYRRTVCPIFDQAYCALLDDLRDRGLLDSTLVIATGEFGRTPILNGRGGRDHWPGVWSALLAGAGVEGGLVVGSSDAMGGEPKDHPIHASELAAMMRHTLAV